MGSLFRLASATAAFTRPADTNAYAANDAVANSTSAPAVLTFANLVRVGGQGGYITKARIWTDQSTCAARFRLHLWNVTQTPINDNAAFTLLWANRAAYVGSITFAAAATEGSGSDAAAAADATLRLPFVATGSLVGLLETLDIFTPASGQRFFIELTADQG
jgi:hypothetical protein